MQRARPVPALMAGSIVVAVVATLTIPGGWMTWMPVGVALAVVGKIYHASGR